MSIVKKINEVMNKSLDAKTTFEMLLKISFENNKDMGNTFDVAFCSLDPSKSPDFCKELVECYLQHEAKGCYTLFKSLYLARNEMEKDYSISDNSHISFLEMCIQTFFAHQKNFYFISNLNALNILEKEFADNKEQYRIAFNECLDFMKEKNIASSLNVLKTIEVLKS